MSFLLWLLGAIGAAIIAVVVEKIWHPIQRLLRFVISKLPLQFRILTLEQRIARLEKRLSDIELEWQITKDKIQKYEEWDIQRQKFMRPESNIYHDKERNLFYCVPCSEKRREVTPVIELPDRWNCPACGFTQWKGGKPPELPRQTVI